MTATEETDAAAFLEDLCRDIGAAVIRFTPMLERLGWERASSARRYLHATTPATGIFIDFIDVACGFKGADEARARLLAIAETWEMDGPPAIPGLH